MDPLTLLRELFGEEPIRKVVTSGFDSVHKIAAATPESLSFFSGINEVVARQIVASAEESLAGPPLSAYRGSLTGTAEEHALQEAGPAVKQKTPPFPRFPAPREEKVPADLLDENPLLDAGGILKTVARSPRPKNLMSDEELLDQVGLSDAEATFLEGISPWPGGETPRRERTSSAPLEARPIPVHSVPGHEEKEVEYAPISDWSPEMDPDPVPRLVRAPELEPAPPSSEKPEVEPGISPVFGQPDSPPAAEEPPARIAAVENTEPAGAAVREKTPETPSLWRFGK